MPSQSFITTEGKTVKILAQGRHNSDQGPDFTDARIELDGLLWAGNIEIHSASSDWYRHKHHKDPVYNTTILHVVEKADREIYTLDGQVVPQVVIEIPDRLKENYEELLATTDYPRCHKFVPKIPSIKIHSWMDSLLVERLEQRAQRVLSVLSECRGDWEQTAFIFLARNFGFGLNGDIFEMWAKSVPLSAAGKHRDNLFQIESMFLGLAGLIGRIGDEEERQKMLAEYNFLAHKFSLSQSTPTSAWHYLRTRPQNFPHVRIRQMARLFHEGRCTLSSLLGATSLADVDNMLSDAGISKNSRTLITINTIATLLYAYDLHKGTYEWRDRAISFLGQIPGENNRILRQWKACGLEVGTAYDSQALIQLKKIYCDKARCLDCRLGFEYLSHIMKQHG